MRKVRKLDAPAILLENKESWDALYAEKPSDYNRDRYRHPAIKATLLEETHMKCVYCESKIGHNCPGDTEHKAPKGKRPDLLFEWQNMTIACTECNRRKSDYYDPECQFLDPNEDDVESMVVHLGPFVFSAPGNPRSETTVRMLELDRMEARVELIARKLERLEVVRNLVERAVAESNPALRDLLLDDVRERCVSSAEYSGTVKTYVDGLGWSKTDIARPGLVETVVGGA